MELGGEPRNDVMNTPADARRRWLGVFFLILAAGQLTWGLTLLKPHLKGWWFLAYWFPCFIFTGLAFLMAWLDLRALRRRAREQQRKLFERTMKGLPPEEGQEQ